MYQLFVRRPMETQWQFVALYKLQQLAKHLIAELEAIGCEVKWVPLHGQDVVH